MLMHIIKKIIKFFRYTLIYISIYLVLDVFIFYITPNKVKSKIYNKRAHKIHSKYYHHDLRPHAVFYDNWGNEKNLIYSNDLGFKYSNNLKSNFKKKNVLFLGDSLVEGVGVKYEDTFVGQIEEIYKDKPIAFFNGSLQSYSNGIYLAKVYDLVIRKKYQFDEIFIFFTANDVHDDFFRYKEVDNNYVLNHDDKKNIILLNFINFVKGNTFIYQIAAELSPPRAGINKIKDAISYIFSEKKIKENHTTNKIIKPKVSENVIKNLTSRKDYEFLYNEEKLEEWGLKAIYKSLSHLERLLKLGRENNIKITLVYPYEAPFLLKKPNEKIFNKFIEYFKNLAKKYNSEFILLNNYYTKFNNDRNAYEELFFMGDVHWNKNGHLRVFQEMNSKVKFY